MMKSKDEKRFQIIGNIVMIIMTILAVAPLLLVIISSLTDNNTLIRNGYSYFPEKFSLAAYNYIFVENPQVLKAYAISFELTAVGTVISLCVTTLLAYAISKKDIPGKGIMTFYIFFTMLFNGGLVPTYINYVNVFHIKDTFWALLVPGLVTNGFNILLMKSYFASSIPDEIMEAAYIDGASETQTFLRIVVPLAKPIIATIGLFAGIAYWNDWNNGYVYLNRRQDLYSIQNLLNRIVQNIQYLTQSGDSNAAALLADLPTVSVRMAMAIAGVMPILVVYPFVQNNFVKGITLGGVKG
ncbi:carbohydrate ABC transporter permease [Eisenbergiella massiliensis]|uniref:Carbohydrate ABC transporter permease n=2 Tax=Lachnospiraceae TaxID=186803 RepID=A0A3E3IWQ0_9FIRM|nr:carbohydrate ABC transporter permease [Eisenbergiella massiliensis]